MTLENAAKAALILLTSGAVTCDSPTAMAIVVQALRDVLNEKKDELDAK